jgi:RNA polymerase sigma-70 factor (ECF subfamily)
MEGMMNDDNLIKLLKKNPSRGLSCAIDQYGGLVKTIAVRIIGYENQQDIEECVSDVFVELWKSIDNYNKDKGILKNYIISIARFVCINKFKRKMNHTEIIPLEESGLELDFDMDDEVSAGINKKIIKDTIYSLPQPDKDIFVRRYYLYENVKDIADNLGLNAKMVENKLYRGKEKLKVALLENGIII